MQYTVGGFLMHHGISGQKHGVRHGPPYPIRRDSGGKPLMVVHNKKDTKKLLERTRPKPERNTVKQPSSNPPELHPKKKVRVSNLTDEQLRARISRLELEKRYKDLVQPNNSAKVNKGRNETAQALRKYGDKIILNSLDLGFKTLDLMVTNAFGGGKKKK